MTPARPVALITGAARRVGLAIAHTFAASGCDLILTYRSSAAEAERAARDLRALGAEVRLERLDLNDLPAVEAFAARLARDTRLDILIHNASVYTPTPAADITAEPALEHHRVNAIAPLLLTARLAPRLAQSTLPGGGAVIAMCDIHAMGRPRRGYTAYSMSKAALAEMVQSLARELAPKVRVNGLAPGAILFAESGPDADPAMQQRYLSRVPLARAGTPEEAAEAARWLALDATYITGEVIHLDGGRWLT